jgi:predicted RNA-binding Zn-ribbon protein involved in translation (DUF1610 family)
MSRSPQFQVDGEWFPIWPEDENPILAAQQAAHLREAKERQARKFACPDCGELGAMRPGNDRYHPDVCPKRGGAS